MTWARATARLRLSAVRTNGARLPRVLPCKLVLAATAVLTLAMATVVAPWEGGSEKWLPGQGGGDQEQRERQPMIPPPIVTSVAPPTFPLAPPNRPAQEASAR
jgi:hypothetical protein